MKPRMRNSIWTKVQAIKTPMTITIRCSRTKSMCRIVRGLGNHGARMLILICEAESLLDRQNEGSRHRLADGGVPEAYGALHSLGRARAPERRRAARADGKACGAD